MAGRRTKSVYDSRSLGYCQTRLLPLAVKRDIAVIIFVSFAIIADAKSRATACASARKSGVLRLLGYFVAFMSIS